VLAISIRSYRAGLIIGGGIFVLALASCWYNSFFWPLKIAMAILVVWVGLSCWFEQFKVTRLNLTTDACYAQVNGDDWMPVELAVHYRDGVVLVLKLRCLDASLPYFRHVLWVWLYPGIITELEQRRLRCFLANEFNPAKVS
jgi:hypothetical protein